MVEQPGLVRGRERFQLALARRRQCRERIVAEVVGVQTRGGVGGGCARQQPYGKNVARDNVIDNLANGDVAGGAVLPGRWRHFAGDPFELGGRLLDNIQVQSTHTATL